MFGKHFTCMYSGSMIGAGAHVFAVWGYVISHQRPPDFTVELNPKLLAFILGEPEEKVVQAIEKLCSTDAGSRSQDHDGRKLIRQGEYLYHVVNGAHYHSIKSDEEKRAYWREQKRRQAEKAGKKPPVEILEKAYHRDTEAVLHYLNEKTGRDLRRVDGNLGPISARLSESGVTLDGVKMMIDRQCARWKTDAKMSEYLRPETLFGKTKFDSYYSARELPVNQSENNGRKNVDHNQTQEHLEAPLWNFTKKAAAQ